MSLMHWGDKWAVTEAGPPVLLTHQKCGHAPGPVLACEHCRETLDPREVSVRRRDGRPGIGGERVTSASERS
jgi:hypothetical protein